MNNWLKLFGLESCLFKDYKGYVSYALGKDNMVISQCSLCNGFDWISDTIYNIDTFQLTMHNSIYNDDGKCPSICHQRSILLGYI